MTPNWMRKVSGLMLTVVISACAPAQPAPPSATGLSEAGAKEIETVMARYTASDRFPGAVVLVAQGDDVKYWKAFGVRDLAERGPVQPNDVFRIYSLTKPVTVAGLLQLVEQGRVGLDDRVDQYVPVLAGLRVYDGTARGRPPRQPLTVRHLLTYASGLTYGIYGKTSPADAIVVEAKLVERATSLDDLMNRLAALPLVHDPGSAISYGFQMDVVGKIIEAVSGQPLDRYLHDHIFAPLGMRETGFHVQSRDLGRVPGLYFVEPGKPPAKSEDWTGAYGAPPRVLWGGHGLVSTPEDYLRFVRMMVAGGEFEGRRILQRETVRMMTSPQVPIAHPGVRERLAPGLTYGFGCIVATDIEAAGGGGHDGLYYFSGAANLFAWVDPATDVIGLAWAQSLPYEVYPFFPDVRRAVASAVAR